MTEEPKTLKDFDLEKIIPFYLSETNDIENWDNWSFEHLALNIRNELKQEAIKEIKELIRTKEFLEIFGCDVEPLIEYIKWKNNVEEEDLK